jgi:hypothetical protein
MREVVGGSLSRIDYGQVKVVVVLPRSRGLKL